MQLKDNITALATPAGAGAIAVIRVSGPDALEIGDAVFKPYGEKKLGNQPSHTLHLGQVHDGARIIDEALV